MALSYFQRKAGEEECHSGMVAWAQPSGKLRLRSAQGMVQDLALAAQKHPRLPLMLMLQPLPGPGAAAASPWPSWPCGASRAAEAVPGQARARHQVQLLRDKTLATSHQDRFWGSPTPLPNHPQLMHIPNSTSLRIIPPLSRHPFHLPWEHPVSMLASTIPKLLASCPRGSHASPTSFNRSHPGKSLASSSAWPLLQVIKQCWGQDKLPAGLHTRCKSKRKREQQEPEPAGAFPRGGGEVAGSSLPPPSLGIVLPGDRKSLLCQGLETSHTTPAAKVPFAPALH